VKSLNWGVAQFVFRESWFEDNYVFIRVARWSSVLTVISSLAQDGGGKASGDSCANETAPSNRYMRRLRSLFLVQAFPREVEMVSD
jgi:hypothetical protein